MRKPGRPKASKLSRAEQLRQAKQRQRARQRAAGLVNVQLAAPRQLAEKIVIARRSGELQRALEQTLDQVIIPLKEYPQLADLAWNRSDAYMAAREAFQLYERNWRFVNEQALTERERQLIDRLKREYGAGVINA